MFVRRGDRERPHLDWRVRLFVAGALLATVGMAIQVSWLVWSAMVFLLAAVALRYVPPREPDTGAAETGASERDGGSGGVAGGDPDARRGEGTAPPNFTA